ncbi:MAG: thrombospondin type 3 repeat-containing protein [Gammaproteobacteria bacterium]
MRRKLCLLSGLMVVMSPLATQAADLAYSGEVVDVTGAFVALTPPGTEVGGPIVVDDAALAGGLIGIADIVSINVNVGGFCFATDGGDCSGVGSLVPITSIDSAAITGTGGPLGGSFTVTAFSPTFNVSIPISFDLDNQSFAGDGGAIGTVGGTGMLTGPSPDTDGDGVSDDVDNCTLVANPGQTDTNGDGIGNRCDADVNNDCIVNFIDISQFTPKFNSAVGDANYDEDFDIDNSGSLNFIDYIAFTGNFQMPPGPSANECVLPE